MSEPFRYDIFISHSSQDKPVVSELAERLKGDGLRVWFDQWEIKAGDMIGLKIEEGLEQSRTLVLVMSTNAFASEWVTLERHTALFRDPTNAQRRFIPLRLDDAEIKDTLKQFAYVDWRQKSDEQYAKLLAGCQTDGDTSKPSSDPPENVKALLKHATSAFEDGRFEEARNAWMNAIQLADAGGYIATKMRAKTNLAPILWHWDRKPEAAKTLLEACLQELRNTSFDRERSNALFQLGTVMGVLGDSDQAASLLKQALDLYRKLGRKLGEADTLVQLGWEIGGRGASPETLELNRQAFDCFMIVYQGDDPKKREDAVRGIAECYFQRAMVHKRDGKVEEAEAALMNSLEWQRKVTANHQLAKILRELGGCKFHQREIQQGRDFLKEAAEIYGSLSHYLEEARCLDMMGRLLFTLGKRKQAEMYFAGAATAAAKAKHDEETAEFLFKLGQMRLDDGKLDDARRLFEQARDTAGDRDQAQCLAALARVAEIEKKPEESKLLLREAIESVKRFLPTVQLPPKRASLLGDIGSYHQKLGEYAEALNYFQKAKEIFETISNLHGVAETLGVIAHLKGRLGRENEERETYIEVRKLVDGTPFYDIIAVADINLAEFEMRKGNLDEAKRILKSAEILCREYQLPYLEHVVLSLDHVESALIARQPPDIGMNELIDELCDQLRTCPQNKDGYLRYWTFSRSKELSGNLRGSLGLHLMTVENDLEAFQLLAARFGTYADWNLLAVPSEFPENVLDTIPVAKKMRVFRGTVMPCVKQGEDYELGEQALDSLMEALQDGRMTRQDLPDPLRYLTIAKGGTLPRYLIVNTGEESDESSGLTGYAIAGWSLALPQQFHQLVFENDAQGLKDQKIFFMYYNRNAVEDGLLWDLRLGKEFRFLPVYRGSLPHSERVQLVASSAMKLPVFSDAAKNGLSNEAHKIKQGLVELLHCTENSARNVLRQLLSDVGDCIRAEKPTDFINLQVYLLKWSDNLGDKLHPAILVKD